MLSFVARRLLQTVPILAAVALLIFMIFSVIPGTFASSMSGDGRSVLDAQVMERMNKEFGLDDPVPVRFAKYIGQLARLDLGTSFRTRQPVIAALSERSWPTIELTLAAMVFAAVLGVPLGFLAALRPGSPLDTASMVLAVSGLSLPKFWLGLLLMYLFALLLGWLPSFGYGDGGLRHLVLPAVALGVGPLALLARTTRAAVLEILNADFVRTARSKGMSERRIVQWHLARNALIIVLTTVGLEFGSIIGQAVVVEKLFAWPGLGSLLVDSVALRDIPVVQGCILVIVIFFLLVNMLVDVLCAVIDPRIKYS
ncbi:peptide/nickel transport system permease protein [Rhizobiales bacterium GAS191]|jgi:glutathione transport system permease protein|nr:peptide/nickel transport system permease protein [Rhizobiales bacterium GAS113]SED91429.1 peptide/nickel transport system permease protein [Rhizobiales bacterium GAS188]SEE59284.1 peptide/nickel transport system permease protein [Rhizobiales bacterium GAS191]